MHKFMHIRIIINKVGRIFNLSCLCVLMCFLFLSANAASASNGKVSQTHALFVLSKDSASYTHVVDLIITEWAKNNQYAIVLKEEQNKLEIMLDKTDIVISLGTSAAEAVFKNKSKKTTYSNLNNRKFIW